MGGINSSTSKPLAAAFGKEQEGTRGPALASMVLRAPVGNGYRLLLVGPLGAKVFDAHTAEAVALEDAAVAAAMTAHSPFSACCVGEEWPATDTPAAGSCAYPVAPSTQLAIGCQDGAVLVFALTGGALTGPVYELRVETDVEGPEAVPAGPGAGAGGATKSLAMSVTVLRIAGGGKELYAGACGRCRMWDLGSGELRREFHLPASGDRPVTPGALCVVRDVRAAAEDGAQLWIGLDSGSIAVFDIQSGVLVRNFSCAGPETVVSLALFRANALVFALSAHRRVSVWDAIGFGFLQKYPAELITCGADLSAMFALDLPALGTEPEASLLLLAGVDGSLCIRRVGRRHDGKINCVLLCYMEGVGCNLGCPITCIDYHAATDTALFGDAACTVSLLAPLREQLGQNVAEIPRFGGGGAQPAAIGSQPVAGAGAAAAQSEEPARVDEEAGLGGEEARPEVSSAGTDANAEPPSQAIPVFSG